jgi:hypothetical protein
VAFDDNAFAITSAIPRAAAIPMYNGEQGTDAKNHVQNRLWRSESVVIPPINNFGVHQKESKKLSGRESFFGRRSAQRPWSKTRSSLSTC